MALFKISKGQKANLPNTYTEGWCYFTTDDGKFYIDTAGSGGNTGERISLNAQYADGIRLGAVLNSSLTNYKEVSIEGIDALVPGLIIAVRNNSVVSTSDVYIKINNITNNYDLSLPAAERGFRPVMINEDTPLQNQWQIGHIILLLYDFSAAEWLVIGGINDIEESSVVSIYRYTTT